MATSLLHQSAPSHERTLWNLGTAGQVASGASEADIISVIAGERITCMALPQPEDLTSLVLRTDFSNDAAWDAVRAAIDGADVHRSATYVSDPLFTGVSVQALVDEDAAADDDKLFYLFLADTTTMIDAEHPLLAVDLYDEPGRTFRVPPRWYAEISANLTISNMDFAEFADATDGSGAYRGFSDD